MCTHRFASIPIVGEGSEAISTPSMRSRVSRARFLVSRGTWKPQKCDDVAHTGRPHTEFFLAPVFMRATHVDDGEGLCNSASRRLKSVNSSRDAHSAEAGARPLPLLAATIEPPQPPPEPLRELLGVGANVVAVVAVQGAGCCGVGRDSASEVAGVPRGSGDSAPALLASPGKGMTSAASPPPLAMCTPM